MSKYKLPELRERCKYYLESNTFNKTVSRKYFSKYIKTTYLKAHPNETKADLRSQYAYVYVC